MPWRLWKRVVPEVLLGAVLASLTAARGWSSELPAPMVPGKSDVEAAAGGVADEANRQSVTAVPPVSGGERATSIRDVSLAAVFAPLENKLAAVKMPDEGIIARQGVDRDPYFGHFERTSIHWIAPNLAHRTLYFEDVAVERFGISWGPVLQPAASGVRFFHDLSVMPVRRLFRPRCAEEQLLGYPRVGSPPETIVRGGASCQ